MMKSSIKFLIILSNILIIWSSIGFYKNQIVGYEISIYDSITFPLVGLILGIFFSIVVAVVSIQEGSKCGKFLSLLIIGLSSLVVIVLPLIKGYFSASMGDNAWHMGYILDISINGYFTQENVYPIVHLLGAVLFSITNFPLSIIAYLIPPFFYVIYITSTYLLCRAVSSETVALIASICSIAPLCYYYSQIMPMGIGFLTLPLVLFLLNKFFHDISPRWSVPLLLYMILLPFLHPLAFLMSFLIVLIFPTVITIFESKLPTKSSRTSIHWNVSRYFIFFAIISAVIFSFWSMHNIVIDNSVSSIISIGDKSPLTVSPIADAGSAFTKLNLNIIGVLFLFIKLYGPLTIFGIFSILGFFYTLIRLHSQGFKEHGFHNKRTNFLMYFYIVFFSFCIIAAIDFIKPLTALGSQRFLFAVYSIIPLPAAIGISFILPNTRTFFDGFDGMKSKIFKISHNKNVARSGFVILTLTLCMSIAIFTLFSSPIVYRPNLANTIEEVIGAGWILDNGDNRYYILWDGKSVSQPDQYAVSTFGTVSNSEFPTREPNLDVDEFAHFRYYKFPNLGASINSPKYLMFREDVSLLIYGELYPYLARYSPEDYLRLSNDNSVNIIYSNNEMKSCFVSPL